MYAQVGVDIFLSPLVITYIEVGGMVKYKIFILRKVLGVLF